MNTSAVAAALSTTPKTLRRFLRADESYVNAGSGGRYEFTETDMPGLRKRFDAWNGTRTRMTSMDAENAMNQKRVRDNGSDDISPVEIRRIIRARGADLNEIRRLANERVDRLEKSLKASGLHISQPQVAKTYKPVA